MPAGYHPHEHVQVKLEDLPLELLTEITALLNLNDTQTLRRTSSKLRAATETRSIWLGHIDELVENQPGLYPDYLIAKQLSFSELRKWCLKRLALPYLWKKKSVDTVVRSAPPLSISTSVDVMLLIPGGKWLLASNSSTVLMGYNLDHEEMKMDVLIDNLLPEEVITRNTNKISTSLIDIWMHEDSPTLNFTLVFLKSRARATTHIQIWDAEEEGNGNTASLQVTHKARIPIYSTSLRDQVLRIQDNFVAYSWNSGGQGRLEIYRWRDCSATHLLKTKFACASKIYDMRILGNYILCVLYQKVAIYRIPDIFIPIHIKSKDTIPNPEDTHWPVPEPSLAWYFSSAPSPVQPFITSTIPIISDNNYRLVVNYNGELLTLELSGTLCVSGRLLCPPLRLEFHSGGFARGYALPSDGTQAIRLNYDYEEGEVLDVDGEGKESTRPWYSGFDEGSGRFVYRECRLLDPIHPAFYVVDIEY